METILLFFLSEGRQKNMLPQEAVAQFKKIYHKVFHVELSDTEAARLANYTLDFYKAIYLPVETEN